MENKRIDLGNGYFAEPDTTAHKDGMDLYNLFDEEENVLAMHVPKTSLQREFFPDGVEIPTVTGMLPNIQWEVNQFFEEMAFSDEHDMFETGNFLYQTNGSVIVELTLPDYGSSPSVKVELPAVSSEKFSLNLFLSDLLETYAIRLYEAFEELMDEIRSIIREEEEYTSTLKDLYWQY